MGAIKLACVNWLSALSRNNARTTTRPRIASSTPISAASIASTRNGNCVYQRVAPTSRMMPISVRRVYAAT